MVWWASLILVSFWSTSNLSLIAYISPSCALIIASFSANYSFCCLILSRKSLTSIEAFLWKSSFVLTASNSSSSLELPTLTLCQWKSMISLKLCPSNLFYWQKINSSKMVPSCSWSEFSLFWFVILPPFTKLSWFKSWYTFSSLFLASFSLAWRSLSPTESSKRSDGDDTCTMVWLFRPPYSTGAFD